MEISVGVVIFVIFILSYLIFHFLTRKTKNIDGKHVVVTGGSSGIGLWAAIDAARKGANVTIVARKIKDLEEAVVVIKENCLRDNQKIEYHSLDLTNEYEIIEDGFKKIEEKSGDIFMLVNCAGAAKSGTIEKFKPEDAKFMMDLNYFGTLYPTRYVLPMMKARKDGIIVLTSSQAGLLGLYGMSSYCATKFALRGLAEVLYMETKHLNINITLALPTDTDTPTLASDRLTKPEITKKLCGDGVIFKPEDVGKKIIEDALMGSFFSIKGLESWFISLVCVGMSPWKNPLLGLLQICTLGHLRLIGMIVQWNFIRTIKKYQKLDDY